MILTFKDFNSYGKCCSSNHNIKDDSYDEVLRHRKGRYYQKWGNVLIRYLHMQVLFILRNKK